MRAHWTQLRFWAILETLQHFHCPSIRPLLVPTLPAARFASCAMYQNARLRPLGRQGRSDSHYLCSNQVTSIAVLPQMGEALRIPHVRFSIH